MIVIEIILIIIWVLSLVACLFISLRNHKVADFRREIIIEDWKRAIKEIDTGTYQSHIDEYDKLPSYSRMVFSFKPLEKKYWIK